MARPRKEIDKVQFEKLCGLQCTQTEIADFFGCSADTIERWCKRTYKKRFAEIYREKRGMGAISLRRMQWRLAEKNAAMAIFLGKQYLGQRDEQKIEISKSIDDSISEMDAYFAQRAKGGEADGKQE